MPGKELIKKFLLALKRRFPKLRFAWAIFTFFIGKSSLHKLGWFRSAWRLSSIDASGKPVPWLTYAAIEFLKGRIKPSAKLKVWEFGSGNSTKWWAQRAAEVHSVEYDKLWYEHVKGELKSFKKVDLIYCELGDDYPKTILRKPTKYDIVVVDGRMRVDCALNALKRLKDNGVIIWDNTERERYQKGIATLLKSGFRKIDFYGPAPIDNVITQTTVFYKDDNVLGI